MGRQARARGPHWLKSRGLIEVTAPHHLEEHPALDVTPQARSGAGRTTKKSTPLLMSPPPPPPP
eukprot:1195203-Prorocentrum_minimum.AAC.1